MLMSFVVDMMVRDLAHTLSHYVKLLRLYGEMMKMLISIGEKTL